MLGFFNLINALFIATNADQLSARDAVPNVRDCRPIFKKYVQKHVMPKNIMPLFSIITTADNINLEDPTIPFHCSVVLDNRTGEVYASIQVGECKASDMFLKDPKTLPKGFFEDYVDEDQIIPSILNSISGKVGCPVYHATVNNSHILYTGIEEYRVPDLNPGTICFGLYGYGESVCDPSLLFQPANIPSPAPNSAPSVFNSTILITVAAFLCVRMSIKCIGQYFCRIRNVNGADAPARNRLQGPLEDAIVLRQIR
jgi:hypothetical protein